VHTVPRSIEQSLHESCKASIPIYALCSPYSALSFFTSIFGHFRVPQVNHVRLYKGKGVKGLMAYYCITLLAL
jgi:hypothetical protein